MYFFQLTQNNIVRKGLGLSDPIVPQYIHFFSEDFTPNPIIVKDYYTRCFLGTYRFVGLYKKILYTTV